MNPIMMRKSEQVGLELRNLYKSHGYFRYEMNTFEEYDFYLRNKDFLTNENMLTFTDTDGKLMALKPDVTFSIIKNHEGGELEKVFYMENVYRPSGDSRNFKEIMQIGLECIGNLDEYAVCEVIMLGAESLGLISENYLLDISDKRFLSGLMNAYIKEPLAQDQLKDLMSRKNLSGIHEFASKEGLDEKTRRLLLKLASSYGPLKKGLEDLQNFVMNKEMDEAYQSLAMISSNLGLYNISDKIMLDLSLFSDSSYYNSTLLKGYIDGIPDAVLTGGRYDGLAQRMGVDAKSIGFAIYTDFLDSLWVEPVESDVDVLITYPRGTDVNRIRQVVKEQIEEGNITRAQEVGPTQIRYKEKIDLD